MRFVHLSTSLLFFREKTVPYPTSACSDSNRGDCVGQAAFADFDLDGSIDVVVPVCVDDPDACSDGGIFFASLKSLWESSSPE